APGTMGKTRIIKAISSVVKPPTGGFFVSSICMPTASVNFPARYTVKTSVAAFLPVQQLCATDPQELMAGKY
ncbi:hypothetical protein, partial [Salmonella enterica]|uniref:hypothetical protein n=1 Tax=Salmonella enterica TaxID=28901 RepID=UPI001C383DB6